MASVGVRFERNSGFLFSLSLLFFLISSFRFDWLPISQSQLTLCLSFCVFSTSFTFRLFCVIFVCSKIEFTSLSTTSIILKYLPSLWIELFLIFFIFRKGLTLTSYGKQFKIKSFNSKAKSRYIVAKSMKKTSHKGFPSDIFPFLLLFFQSLSF